MKIAAIIPVKNIARGKSRLATVINKNQRQELIKYLLANTITELKKISLISEVTIITADRTAAMISKELKSKLIWETGWFGLNWAVMKGIKRSFLNGISTVLILPLDLPLVNAKDIVKFIHVNNRQTAITIAPDSKLEGTNALLVNSKVMIKMKFGSDSFRNHLREAKKNNLAIHTCAMDCFSFDLDNPEDYQFYSESERCKKITEHYKEKNEPCRAIPSRFARPA